MLQLERVRGRAGAMVTDSMICDGALIGEGCNVTGAVIGPGCVIASGHTTPPNARITLCTLRSSGGGGAEGDVAGSRSLDDVESDDGDDDTALQRPTDAILQVRVSLALGLQFGSSVLARTPLNAPSRQPACSSCVFMRCVAQVDEGSI